MATAPSPSTAPTVCTSPEHTKPWDYIVVVLVSLGCLVYIFGNVVMLIYHEYRPMKSRSVFLTVMSSVGGLCWVIATMVVNNHFTRSSHTFWTICSLWTFWLQACFGYALWLNCMALRLVHLYQIFIKVNRDIQKHFHLKWVALPLFVLLMPVIAVCVSASVLHASKFVPFSDFTKKGDCTVKGHEEIAIVLLCLVPVYYMIFLYFAFKLRSVMAPFNEYRVMINGGIMSLFLFLLSLVTIQTKSYCNVAGRCFLSMSVALAVFYYFWAQNYKVIYHVLFDKEEYERQFGNDLNRFSSCRREFSSSIIGSSALDNYKESLLALQEEIRKLSDEYKDLTQIVAAENLIHENGFDSWT